MPPPAGSASTRDPAAFARKHQRKLRHGCILQQLRCAECKGPSRCEGQACFFLMICISFSQNQVAYASTVAILRCDKPGPPSGQHAGESIAAGKENMITFNQCKG